MVPVGSTVQCSARSGTRVPSGPFRTSPEKTRATRSRSAWVFAVNGLTDMGRPRTPSRYGRATTGTEVGCGVATVAVAGRSDGALTRPAMSASNTTRVPTTNESLRVIELRASVRTAVGRRGAGSGGGGGREDECRQAEDDEQDQEDDGELPEPALHSPPAAVDRGIATERA